MAVRGRQTALQGQRENLNQGCSDKVCDPRGMNHWTNLGHNLTKDTINKLEDTVEEGNGVGENKTVIVGERSSRVSSELRR